MDGEHIQEGTKMIFDFLAKNNITHLSKVSNRIRFDDVVVRLVNEQDVDKLMSFVKQNSYIQSGLISANPFAYNKDGIALACDGHLSYNDTVAKFISIYIASNKNNQTLNKVGKDDFYDFLIVYYNNVFANRDYQRIISDFNLNATGQELSDIIINYKQVLELIIKSSSPDFSYDDYLKHYRSNIGLSKNEELVHNVHIPMKDDDALENLLLEIVQVMTHKYGKETTINSIDDYLHSGNTRRITKDNNLRSRAQYFQLCEKLNNVLKQTNLSLTEYINLLKEKHIKLDNNNSKNEILLSGIIGTYKKYQQLSGDGINYVRSAIRRLVLKGDYLGFTRDNGIRETIMNNFSRNDIIDLLKTKYGYTEENDETLEVMCDRFIEDVMSMSKSFHK